MRVAKINEKRKGNTNAKITRFLSLVIAFVVSLVGVWPNVVMATGTESGSGTEMTAIREDADLSGKIVHYQSFDDDGHIGIPFEVATLYDISKGTVKAGYNGTRIIMYIVDTEHSKAANRVGQGEDKEIIQSMLDRGYIVAVIGYYNDAKAVNPNLDYSVQLIRNEILNGNCFADETVIPKSTYVDVYVAPAGYNVSLDNVFWEIDKHSTSGTLEHIVHIWNTDFRGVHAKKIVKWVITDENGNPVLDGDSKTIRKPIQNGKDGSSPVWYSDAAGTVIDNENGIYTKVDYTKAETIHDCCNPDGTPLDLNLRMSVAYPVNPSEKVPAMTLSSSSGYITNNYNKDYIPHFNGFMFKGYVQAVYEYLWIPMAHDDSFGYFDGAAAAGSVTKDHGSYGLHDYNDVLSDTAAMRYLRYMLADKEGNGETKFTGEIGIMGNSKGSLMTHLGRAGFKSHVIEEGKVLTNEDIAALDEHYSTMSNVRQFEGKNGYSRYLNEETTSSDNGYGYYVIDGGEMQPWLTYSEGSEKAGQEILSSAEAVYSSNGANLNHVGVGSSPMFIGSNHLDELDNHYGGNPALVTLCKNGNVPSMLFEVDLGHRYVYGNDKNHNVDTYQAIFDFFGHYLKDEAVKVMYTEPTAGYERMSLKSPIVIKFSGPVAQEEIEKVTLKNGNNEIEGVWASSFGDTEWTFIPYGEKWTGNTTYTLTVPEGFMGKNGTKTTDAYTCTYTTEYDNTVEVAVSANSFTVTVPDYTDAENRAYVRFLVSNDAANIADLYDGDTLVGSVNLKGSGYYEIDVTNYLSGKSAGSSVTFTIVPQKTAGETVIATDLAAETDISPTLRKSQESEPNCTYYSKQKMYSLLYPTGALREDAYGRKFKMSVDIYDNISRAITLSVPQITDKSKQIIDYDQANYDLVTTKGQWKTFEIDYVCYEKEYGNKSYRTPRFEISIESAGENGPQILAKNVKITEIVTDIEVSKASLSVRRDGSAYSYKAPENVKAFALVPQSGEATYYAGFNSAMSAYKAGDTLKLMSNYAFTDADVFDGYTQGVTDTYVIDLSGYRIDLNNTTGGLITAGLSSSGNDSVNITLKNGSAFVGATPVVSYSGDAGATTNYDISIENVYIGALPYASTKGIVNSPSGVVGASGASVNLALNDCDISIDADSIPQSYASVFANADTDMPLSITMDGGNMSLTSLRWLTLANDVRTVKYTKEGGEHTTFSMPASMANAETVNVFVNNGSNDVMGAFTKGSVTNGVADYTIEIHSNSTPYGIIPDEYLDAEAYPFVMFDGNGNFVGATDVFARKTNESSCVLGMLSKAKITYTYLRRDYEDSTSEVFDNLSLLDSTTANIDLGGHTFTWNGTKSLIYAQAKRNTSLQFNISNGTMQTSKAPLIELAGWKTSNYDLSKTLHYYGFNFSDITFKLAENSTLGSLICNYTVNSTAPASYDTNLTYTDCVFDLTNATSNISVINLNNQTGYGNVCHEIRGGKIIAKSLDNVDIVSSVSGSTSLVVAKSGGDYPKLYLEAGATAPTDADVIKLSGTVVKFESAGTETIDGQSYDVYTSSVKVAIDGYGEFPEEYADAETYPFFVFYEQTDGAYVFQTAVSKWGKDSDSTTALGYCQNVAGPGLKKVIYLRRDFSITDGTLYFSNLAYMATTGLVIDLGGNTLTNSSANSSLLDFNQKGYNSKKTVEFKNGTIVASKHAPLMITGQQSSSQAAGGREMNAIFSNVTLKYGASYTSGEGGLRYTTRETSGTTMATAYTTNITYNDCIFDLTALTNDFALFNAGYDDYANTNIIINGGRVVASDFLNVTLDSEHTSSAATNSVVYKPSNNEYIKLLLKDTTGFDGVAIDANGEAGIILSLDTTETYGDESYYVYGVTDKNFARINNKIESGKFTCDMYFDDTFTSGAAVAIIAFYGEDGELAHIAIKDITVANGVVPVEITVGAPEYDHYAVYVWKDLEGCRPLVEN